MVDTTALEVTPSRARAAQSGTPHPRLRGRFALGSVAVIAATTLALTACSSSKNTTAASAPTPSSTVSTATGIQISSVAGRLVGPNGHTLYFNNVDTMTSIKCTGDCAKEWPPLTGTPTTTGALQATDFATVARPDGAMQVTFEGHPLYYFANDKSASAVNGNITEDGVVWHSADSSVVSTTGGVSSAPAASPTSGGTSSSGYSGY